MLHVYLPNFNFLIQRLLFHSSKSVEIRIGQRIRDYQSTLACLLEVHYHVNHVNHVSDLICDNKIFFMFFIQELLCVVTYNCQCMLSRTSKLHYLISRLSQVVRIAP